MKVTVQVDPPVPVQPVVQSVTIVLTAEEAKLLMKDYWCGPKAHTNTMGYFGCGAGDGAIANNLDDVNTGVQLRDLLRAIAIKIKAEVGGRYML